MKSAILILAFLWAATAPLPKRAKLYFLVQVFAALCMEGLLLIGYRVNATEYEIVYAACTLAILASGFYVVWEAMRVYGIPQRLLWILETTASAVFFTYLAAYAIHHDYHAIPHFLWIPLGEATLLVISGCSLGTAVPLLAGRDRLLTGILAATWLAKAGILYFYSINILGNTALWIHLGAYLPVLLFTVACGYLGRKLRLMAKETALAAQ